MFMGGEDVSSTVYLCGCFVGFLLFILFQKKRIARVTGKSGAGGGGGKKKGGEIVLFPFICSNCDIFF